MGNQIAAPGGVTTQRFLTLEEVLSGHQAFADSDQRSDLSDRETKFEAFGFGEKRRESADTTITSQLAQLNLGEDLLQDPAQPSIEDLDLLNRVVLDAFDFAIALEHIKKFSTSAARFAGLAAASSGQFVQLREEDFLISGKYQQLAVDLTTDLHDFFGVPSEEEDLIEPPPRGSPFGNGFRRRSTADPAPLLGVATKTAFSSGSVSSDMRLWQIGHINELSSEHVRHFKRTGDYVVKAMAQVIERGKHGGDPSRSPCGASPGSAAFPELSLCTPCVESADERGFCITTSPSFSGGDDFSMIEDQNAEELVHRAMLLIYNNMARGAFVNVGSQRRVSKEVLLNALRLYLLPVEAFCGSKIFIHEGYTPHHGEALCVEYQLRPYVGTNILFDAYTYKSPLGQCCIGVETASVQTQRIDIFTYTNSKKARVNKDDQIEACIGKGTDIQALQQILGLLGASYVIPIRTEVGFDLLGFACLTMGTQEIRRGGLDFVYAVGREETAATRWYIGSKPPEVQNQNFTVRPSPVTSVHYANFTVV